MSKSDFSFKDIYATHKIKDEIEWGVHIRETRKQGEQIELTPKSIEAKPIIAYRGAPKKRRKRKKRGLLTATNPPNDNNTLNRETCSKKQYFNWLSTPRIKVELPQNEGLKPILTPCPPRFVQLAVPKKQLVFNTWQSYEDTLPAKNILHLQQLLEKEEALGPKDAARYFKQLNLKKKLKKKLKEKEQKQPKLSKPKRTKVMKEISKLVDSVINFLTKKPTAEVKHRHMIITEIIKEKLAANRIIRPYKRGDCKNVNSKTVHEVLDQVAVWLDTHIDMEDESDEEYDELTEKASEISTVSTITYINLLLSISDSMASELGEIEKASVSTMHAVEEVLEEIYELSETEMLEGFEEAAREAEEGEAEEELILATEREEEGEEDRDSGIGSDVADEELSESEHDWVEVEGEAGYESGEGLAEGEIQGEALAIMEEEGEEEGEGKPEGEVEPEGEGKLEELLGEGEGEEEGEDAGSQETVIARSEEPEAEEEDLLAKEEPETPLPETVSFEQPELLGEQEDIEKMQRELLDEFYEQQVKPQLVSKEELAVAEPPSGALAASLMELAKTASITVEEHSPGTVCCLSLKTWATWLLQVVENSQIWSEWLQRTIGQLKYYASVLQGKERNEDGSIKTLSSSEWSGFVESVSKDVVSWRQYNMHVQDLSMDIIENFSNKRVICCPECLRSKLIISEATAHDVTDHLVEALKTSSYWRRWLNSIIMETEKLSSINLAPIPSLDMPSTSSTRSVYELIEFKVVQKKSSDAVFTIEEIERDPE